MLGKQSDLGGGEHPYLDHVGRDSFYGFLASHRGELFRDEDFAELYCSDNGRPSVPPSLLWQRRCSCKPTRGRPTRRTEGAGGFRLALEGGAGSRPRGTALRQEHAAVVSQARLILHERVRAIFQKSLAFAPQTGYFRSRKKLKVVLDTTYILGRGAVKDTYNLLADGITKLARALAAEIHPSPQEEWTREHGLGRYFGRTKTLFQLLLAATVANLTLVATGAGLMRDRNHPRTIISVQIRALLAALIAIRSLFAAPSLGPRLRMWFRSRTFRPRF